MTAFFLNILEITAGMSALVLLMLLILKLFGAKFTAKCRYVLWMLVLVRLAIPFSLNILPAMIEVPVVPAVMESVPDNTESEDPTQNFTPDENLPSENLGTVITPGENSPTDPTVPTDPTIPTDPADPIIPIIPVTPTDPVTPPAADDPSISDPSKEEILPPDPVTESPREPISAKTILEIISVVYVAGAVAFFAWNMLSYLIYTRRILEVARPADARTVAVFRSICAKEKLSRTPTLLVSPEINSPAAFGIFRRKVVLPDIEFSDNGLAGTLFHEAIHCKRGDLFVKLVELVARSLHWFNPLVHIAAFRCEMEMEMSCDEKVLAGVSDDARLAYGRVMLDIIRRCRRNRGALTTHFNPKKSSVKSRFANIINGSGNRNGKALIAICLVLCILAGAIIACTTEVNNPEDETPSQTETDPDETDPPEEETDPTEDETNPPEETDSQIDTTKYVKVLENNAGLQFSSIVLPKNQSIAYYEFDEEHMLLLTHGKERDENNDITSYSDFTFYLVNTMTGTLVDYVNLGDLSYRPLSTSDYTDDGLILSDWHLDGYGNIVVRGAIKVTLEYGRLRVKEVETDIYPHHESRLKSPDGRYTVYDTMDYGSGHGGIDVRYPDGTTKRILTNVLEGDPGVTSLGGVTGYSPIQFIDNNTLLYHIGGWEWTQGYGIYNLATGEMTEFRNGYGVLGYMDGIVYSTKVKNYEYAAWYGDTLAGGELTMLASVDEVGDTAVFHVTSPYTFKLAGTNWRSIYHVNSVASKSGKEQVEIELYSLDLRKHSPNETKKPLAKVSYDVSNAEIYAISHYSTETAVVFVEGYELPEKEEPIVNIISNPGGLDIKAVLLPVEKSGGYMDAIKFDEQHMLYITYEVAKNEETGKSYKRKPHLYLIDILNGVIKADYTYYLEDGEDFSMFDVDYTADGIIFMLMGNLGDRLGVMKAHRITLSGDTLALEPVERTELYPYNSNKIVSPTGEYVVYYRDEGGYGDGGIDVVYAGGATHRILKNAPLPIEGGSLIAVTYYTPVGFADNSHLVYTIGGYEHIKGFGIYDLATGENLMFDDGKYQLSIVGDGVISFEEVRRNDEGLPEQYRTWSMTLDGKMTLTTSVDEADGVMKMPDNITNRLRREPVYAFYTGSTREVPDYFYKTVSYRVETLYSADMKEKLAVIEYPSDSNKRSVRNIHFAGDSATIVLPVEPHIALYTDVEFTTVSFTYTHEENPFFGYTMTYDVPSYCYYFNGSYFEPNSHLLNSEQSIFRALLSGREYSYKEFMAGKNSIAYDRNPITVTKDNGEIINGFLGYVDEEGTTYRTYNFYFPTEDQDKGFVLSLRERLEGDGEYYYNNIILPIVYSVKIEKTTFTQDGGKIYFTSSPTSFLPPEANSRIGDLKFGSSHIITYATANDDLCVYYSYGLDAELFIMLKTEFESADIQSYYNSEVLEPGVNEDGIVTITVRYYHLGIACYTDVTYEIDPNLYVASGEPNDERVYRTPMWKPVDTAFTLHEAAVPSIIIGNNGSLEFWHKFMNSSRYIYFITLRDDGNPVRVYLYHFDTSNASAINSVGIPIPEDVEYDYIMPVNYITGGGSMECRFYLELRHGSEVFYVAFDNFHWETGEDILDFRYKGIVPDSEIAELHKNNPELFADPEISKIPAEELFTSILENKTKFFSADYKEDMFLSEYLRTDYFVKKYSFVDMDQDGEVEMVLWLRYKNDSYAIFLVLHRETDIVYAHGFVYRGMNGLKDNGMHTSSGGAAHSRICRLEFNGGECTQNWIAHHDLEPGATELTYYIGGEVTTKEEYDKYYDRYDSARFATWYSYEEDSITNIDDWNSFTWATQQMSPDGSIMPSHNVYTFIRDLVKAETDIPELNGLGITDYKIELHIDSEYDSKFRFTFTVTGNTLPETLPPGTYTWTIVDGEIEMYISDYGSAPSEDLVSYPVPYHGLSIEFSKYSAALAVDAFLRWAPYSYEISPYGEWDDNEDWTFPYNYICGYYGGDDIEVSFDEMQRLMSEKFGITLERPDTDKRLYRCEYSKQTDTVWYAETRGYVSAHQVIDVKYDDGITYVTVQLYVDRLRLIPSHKVCYTIGERDVFLSSEIVEQGKYEPHELS